MPWLGKENKDAKREGLATKLQRLLSSNPTHEILVTKWSNPVYEDSIQDAGTDGPLVRGITRHRDARFSHVSNPEPLPGPRSSLQTGIDVGQAMKDMQLNQYQQADDGYDSRSSSDQPVRCFPRLRLLRGKKAAARRARSRSRSRQKSRPRARSAWPDDGPQMRMSMPEHPSSAGTSGVHQRPVSVPAPVNESDPLAIEYQPPLPRLKIPRSALRSPLTSKAMMRPHAATSDSPKLAPRASSPAAPNAGPAVHPSQAAAPSRLRHPRASDDVVAVDQRNTQPQVCLPGLSAGQVSIAGLSASQQPQVILTAEPSGLGELLGNPSGSSAAACKPDESSRVATAGGSALGDITQAVANTPVNTRQRRARVRMGFEDTEQAPAYHSSNNSSRSPPPLTGACAPCEHRSPFDAYGRSRQSHEYNSEKGFPSLTRSTVSSKCSSILAHVAGMSYDDPEPVQDLPAADPSAYEGLASPCSTDRALDTPTCSRAPALNASHTHLIGLAPAMSCELATQPSNILRAVSSSSSLDSTGRQPECDSGVQSNDEGEIALQTSFSAHRLPAIRPRQEVPIPAPAPVTRPVHAPEHVQASVFLTTAANYEWASSGSTHAEAYDCGSNPGSKEATGAGAAIMHNSGACLATRSDSSSTGSNPRLAHLPSPAVDMAASSGVLPDNPRQHRAHGAAVPSHASVTSEWGSQAPWSGTQSVPGEAGSDEMLQHADHPAPGPDYPRLELSVASTANVGIGSSGGPSMAAVAHEDDSLLPDHKLGSTFGNDGGVTRTWEAGCYGVVSSGSVGRLVPGIGCHVESPLGGVAADLSSDANKPNASTFGHDVDVSHAALGSHSTGSHSARSLGCFESDALRHTTPGAAAPCLSSTSTSTARTSSFEDDTLQRTLAGFAISSGGTSHVSPLDANASWASCSSTQDSAPAEAVPPGSQHQLPRPYPPATNTNRRSRSTTSSLGSEASGPSMPRPRIPCADTSSSNTTSTTTTSGSSTSTGSSGGRRRLGPVPTSVVGTGAPASAAHSPTTSNNSNDSGSNGIRSSSSSSDRCLAPVRAVPAADAPTVLSPTTSYTGMDMAQRLTPPRIPLAIMQTAAAPSSTGTRAGASVPAGVDEELAYAGTAHHGTARYLDIYNSPGLVATAASSACSVAADCRAAAATPGHVNTAACTPVRLHNIHGTHAGAEPSLYNTALIAETSQSGVSSLGQHIYEAGVTTGSTQVQVGSDVYSGSTDGSVCDSSPAEEVLAALTSVECTSALRQQQQPATATQVNSALSMERGHLSGFLAEQQQQQVEVPQDVSSASQVQRSSSSASSNCSDYCNPLMQPSIVWQSSRLLGDDVDG